MAEKRYNGLNCPACGSENVSTTDSIDGGGREVWQSCKCDDCGTYYTEEYELKQAVISSEYEPEYERVVSLFQKI